MTLAKENIFNPVVENNQNAILHTDTSIWLGTTHGLLSYKITQDEKAAPVPNTIVQNVWLSAKIKNSIKYAYQRGYRLPANLSLPSNESHIEIGFQASTLGSEKRKTGGIFDQIQAG